MIFSQNLIRRTFKKLFKQEDKQSKNKKMTDYREVCKIFNDYIPGIKKDAIKNQKQHMKAHEEEEAKED